jgi:hypothetical protein
MGRTLLKHSRFYADGINLSGFTRAFGPLMWEFEEVDATCPPGDDAKGYLVGQPTITPTVLNSVMDPATPGVYDINAPGTYRHVMAPLGIGAAPAAGDPVFMGKFLHKGFHSGDDSGLMIATLPFGPNYADGSPAYEVPWGVLLHAYAARTAVNAAVGIDDYGAATALGGYMAYQVFSSDGTATVKVQDAAVNADGSFADLAGATTGVVDFTTAQAGIVELGKTATVRRYLRWQIVLGTATTITFALAFHRGLR